MNQTITAIKIDHCSIMLIKFIYVFTFIFDKRAVDKNERQKKKRYLRDALLHTNYEKSIFFVKVGMT